MRGKLKKIRVDEFTSSEAVTVTPDASLNEVLELLQANGFRHLPVVQAGEVVGVISDRDLLLSHFRHSSKLCVKDAMMRDPYSVKQSDSLETVVFEMSKRKVSSAIVLDGHGKLFGIFTVTDALNALIDVLRGEYPDQT